MKKRIFAAAAAILLLCGCSNASVEELLSPPRLDGEQSEIYDALRKFTNDDIILKYPRSGQYRSAFVVKNLDNEYSDEAIVFYETPNVSDGSSLRMNFLDRQNGKWVSVYDFAASGSEVESVMFRDLGNGAVTILVTYLVQSSSDRTTSIMAYKGGKPQEFANIRNMYMDIFDADGDGNDEVFMISTDRISGNSVSWIYGWIDDKFLLKGSTPLNSGFAGIKNVTCGSCDSSGTKAVFIDYAASDGSFGTDAVVYGNKYFFLSQALTPDSSLRNSNTYTPYISCCDLNGDGTIDIPTTVPFPTYEEMPLSEQVNMTVWHSLIHSGTGKRENFRSFVGTKGDYVLILPQSWKDKITASVSVSEGTVTFFRYNMAVAETREIVLTLYGAAEGSTSKYENDEYIRFGKSDSSGYTYYAQPGDSDISVTAEELQKLFILR